MAITMSLCLLPALLMAVGIDAWCGASLEADFMSRFYFFGIGVGIATLLIGGHQGFLVAPALYLLCLVALPFIDVSPVKPAVRAANEIRPGLSEAQVRAVFERHFPEHGRFERPRIGPISEGRLSFVLDPRDAGLNAALVEVRFVDGASVSARFSPD